MEKCFLKKCCYRYSLRQGVQGAYTFLIVEGVYKIACALIESIPKFPNYEVQIPLALPIDGMTAIFALFCLFQIHKRKGKYLINMGYILALLGGVWILAFEIIIDLFTYVSAISKFQAGCVGALYIYMGLCSWSLGKKYRQKYREAQSDLEDQLLNGKEQFDQNAQGTKNQQLFGEGQQKQTDGYEKIDLEDKGFIRGNDDTSGWNTVSMNQETKKQSKEIGYI